MDAIIDIRAGRPDDDYPELVRWLRIYGGPTLESQRGNADLTLRWAGGVFAALAFFAPLFAGRGFCHRAVPRLGDAFRAAGVRRGRDAA